MKVQELTNSLSENYAKLKSGELDVTLAKELSNMAGKILKSAKLQLEYYQHMKYDKKVDFLEP